MMLELQLQLMQITRITFMHSIQIETKDIMQMLDLSYLRMVAPIGL